MPTLTQRLAAMRVATTLKPEIAQLLERHFDALRDDHAVGLLEAGDMAPEF